MSERKPGESRREFRRRKRVERNWRRLDNGAPVVGHSAIAELLGITSRQLDRLLFPKRGESR